MWSMDNKLWKSVQNDAKKDKDHSGNFKLRNNFENGYQSFGALNYCLEQKEIISRDVSKSTDESVLR